MLSKYRYNYIKQQVDGLKYIGSFVKLKKVGQVYRGLCPFHGEKTPSLTVYPKGYKVINSDPQKYATFYCFGCGVGGDIINFKKLKDNLNDNDQACLALEKEFGIISDDNNIQNSYLQEQLSSIKQSNGNVLNLTEINLICSNICRNYLNWISSNMNDLYNEELQFIDNIYIYIDNELLDRNALEAMNLINEINDKINERKSILNKKNH